MPKIHAIILPLILLAGLVSGCIYDQTQSTNISQEPAASEMKFEGRYIDVHTHIRPGMMLLERIIQNMDKEGIERMVIMESPTDIYNGVPQSEYGIPDAAEKYPDRFVALYGGEAITMLYRAAERGNYTKQDEEKFTALLEDAMSSGKYRGFGEIALLHLADEENESNISAPGGHPWMLLLGDIAARYDVPIDIHMTATNESVEGLERLLDHNRNTKVIWEHAGRSSTVTPKILRQLMERHPNLYASTMIRKPKTPERMAVRILEDDDNITQEWMALFKDFPRRFMIGSDIKPGEDEDDFKHIKKHVKFLNQLPPEIQELIARENAERIYKIKNST